MRCAPGSRRRAATSVVAIEARAAADAARARLDELAAAAETTAALESLGEAKIGLTGLDADWRALEPHLDALGDAGASIRARYAAARERVATREAERHAAEAKALADNLRRLERLADRIEKRAPAPNLTLREAERAMKELRPVIDEPGPLPTRQDRDAIVERLKQAQAALAPRARELREMDDWKRFANAAVQEDLCARTEALLKRLGEPEPPGLDVVAKELREINTKWREAAEAPRAQAQALWHRYRRAFDPIQLLCREHFAAQAQERAANLDREARPLRARRGARRVDRLDQDGGRAARASGGMAEDRTDPARAVQGDLAALPRRLQPLLHAPP